MRYSFHPAARKELNEAVDYYEQCRKGLGIQFTKEVYSAIQRIRKFPKAWSKLSKHSRRCLINRFPYGVIYQILENEILIVAIAQLNRKPIYWRNRLKDKA